MSAGLDVRTLKVRSGVELADGRPIGVVYLVDRPSPVVELIYALPVCEARSLARQINTWTTSAFPVVPPVTARARDRDGAWVELTIPLDHACEAWRTIWRIADQAELRAAPPPCSDIV